MADYKSGADTQGQLKNLLTAIGSVQDAYANRNKLQNNLDVQQMKGQQEQSNEKLKSLLSGKEKDQDVQRALKGYKELNQNASPYGGRTGFKSGTADVTGTSPNQYGMDDKATQQFGANFRKDVGPLRDRMDSANQALTYLMQGNAFSDKMALIPEIKTALGSARGVPSIMAKMNEHAPVNETAVQFWNRFNNSVDIPTQQNMRNAMIESIIANNQRNQQQYKAIRDQYLSQAKANHGLLNPEGTVNNLFAESDNLAGTVNNQANDYMQAKIKSGQGMQSNPGAVSPSNPTQSNLDKVKSWAQGLITPKQTAPATQPSPGDGYDPSWDH